MLAVVGGSEWRSWEVSVCLFLSVVYFSIPRRYSFGERFGVTLGLAPERLSSALGEDPGEACRLHELVLNPHTTLKDRENAMSTMYLFQKWSGR